MNFSGEKAGKDKWLAQFQERFACILATEMIAHCNCRLQFFTDIYFGSNRSQFGGAIPLASTILSNKNSMTQCPPFWDIEYS